jgi:hypothetical protein
MQHGYTPEGDAIDIEGWPVQFLPAFTPLIEEGLENAVDVMYGATPTRVFRAEYLAAIMLYTGRPKDHVRLVQFISEGAVTQDQLAELITRHGLGDKWDTFRRRFLDEEP